MNKDVPNNGVAHQLLNAVLNLTSELGRFGQQLKDLEIFVKRVNKELNKKAGRAEVEDLRRILWERRDNKSCNVMRIHVARNHNEDAILGKKVRKTGNWFKEVFTRKEDVPSR